MRELPVKADKFINAEFILDEHKVESDDLVFIPGYEYPSCLRHILKDIPEEIRGQPFKRYP